MGNSTDR